MRPLELIADVLFIVAAGLAITACALIDTALAFGVAALFACTAAVVLTMIALKRPPADKIPGAHGPFEPGA